MDFDHQIVQLNPSFYKAYPPTTCPEILLKESRPYNCLLIEIYDDVFICLPYRSYIRHKYAYKFKGSLRSRRKESGIDYSKMVIIKDSTYISDVPAVVDKDEYNETMRQLPFIVKQATEYIKDYVEYTHGNKYIDEEEFIRRYKHSTLKYFDDLLPAPLSAAS